MSSSELYACVKRPTRSTSAPYKGASPWPVRPRVLAPTIERANKKARKAGRPEVQSGITNHTLRRTFASLLYESGASPAYVMAKMGHESAVLALEVYSKVMERKRDTGERMDALCPRC